MTLRPSAIVLFGVNLIPIVGVVLFDWRVYDILILYWVENLVIGVVNVLRMAVCKDGIGLHGFQPVIDAAPVEHKRAFRRINKGARFFMIPFFILHYGMFCFGHLSAIQAIFGDYEGHRSLQDIFFGMPISEAVASPLWIGIAAITISHLFSFFSNFIGAGEYQRTSLAQLMQRPYGRVIALHIAIIAGGALVQFLGAPVIMLIVLVVVKTAMDLKLHSNERRTFGEQIL